MRGWIYDSGIYFGLAYKKSRWKLPIIIEMDPTLLFWSNEELPKTPWKLPATRHDKKLSLSLQT